MGETDKQDLSTLHRGDTSALPGSIPGTRPVVTAPTPPLAVTADSARPPFPTTSAHGFRGDGSFGLAMNTGILPPVPDLQLHQPTVGESLQRSGGPLRLLSPPPSRPVPFDVLALLRSSILRGAAPSGPARSPVAPATGRATGPGSAPCPRLEAESEFDGKVEIALHFEGCGILDGILEGMVISVRDLQDVIVTGDTPAPIVQFAYEWLRSENLRFALGVEGGDDGTRGVASVEAEIPGTRSTVGSATLAVGAGHQEVVAGAEVGLRLRIHGGLMMRFELGAEVRGAGDHGRVTMEPTLGMTLSY